MGKGREFWGRKSGFKKIEVGKNIKLLGTLYAPDKTNCQSYLIYFSWNVPGDDEGRRTVLAA